MFRTVIHYKNENTRKLPPLASLEYAIGAAMLRLGTRMNRDRIDYILILNHKNEIVWDSRKS